MYNINNVVFPKYNYTQLLVILGHRKRIQLGYFKFLLFTTIVERKVEGRHVGVRKLNLKNSPLLSKQST